MLIETSCSNSLLNRLLCPETLLLWKLCWIRSGVLVSVDLCLCVYMRRCWISLWFTVVFFSVLLSGVHIVQRMYGCEWDDETNEVDGYEQFGYDGEDFIIFDLQTETWVAPKQQAVVTKHKWDSNKAFITSVKNYYTQICSEWLKKYLNYGRSSLMRTGTITWPDLVWQFTSFLLSNTTFLSPAQLSSVYFLSSSLSANLMCFFKQ